MRWPYWRDFFDDAAESFAPVIFALLVLVLAARCSAQTVRVENAAATPFGGWTRATVGSKPKHERGVLTRPDGDTTAYVLARPIGLDCWAVDVRVHLEPGERVALDLSTALPATLPPFPVGPDALFGWLGGLPQFAGVPMELKALRLDDGAAVTSHWRCRVPPMFVADLWLRWYGEPWMHGEVTLTASNPDVPAVTAATGAWSLRFGDAKVSTPGLADHLAALSLIEPGTSFGDAQARSVPVVLHWPRHGAAPAAVITGAVQACGDVRLWPDGQPVLPPGFDSRAWADGMRNGATATLHTWGPMVFGMGVPPASGVTGDQADQVFVAAQALAHERALLPLYLTALKWANRPCHYREQDGSLLDYLGHRTPRLGMWDARPDSRFSLDLLGKPKVPNQNATVTQAQTSGWWGPDVEHALFNTPAAVCRLRDSPALQLEIEAVARLMPFQWTHAPGGTAPQPWPSRAIGWEAILAVHLWRTLENRPLAEAVATNWRARFDGPIRGHLTSAGVTSTGVWTTHGTPTGGSQLGPGVRWQPWQQAVGAWGLDLAGRVLGRPEACEIALAGAKVVLRDAYEYRNGRWTTRDNLRLDAPSDAPYGLFDAFGCPLAPQLVLRREPGNAKAQEITGQIRAEAVQEKQARWLEPRKAP